LTLNISLFGGFKILDDGQPITTINQPRQQSLLAYLLLNTHSPASRQYIAGLFWPDLPEAQARNNLRQVLHQIRHALPDSQRLIEINTNSVGWRADSPFCLDVFEVDREMARAEEARRISDLIAERDTLGKVLNLYRGSLLPACYDDWIIPERERLHQLCLDALERMALILEGQHDYPAAIPIAQRLVQHDRLHENGYRLLMRLYSLTHDRASAIRTFHTCADILDRELGVEPESTTREIYERLIHTDSAVSALAQDQVQEKSLPLVGRASAWAQVKSSWQNALTRGPRLVIITGEPGIGKTRMAEELVEWCARQGISTAMTRSYASQGQLAYGPLADLLRCNPFRPALKRLDKVWLAEIARLLPELLAEYPHLPDPEPLKETWQRQRFFQGLARAVDEVRPPLLLVIDDLQWCDAETLEWLHYLLRAGSEARILIVGTIRADEIVANQALQALVVDLRAADRLVEIALGPLDAADTVHLAEQVVGKNLDVDTAQNLFRETEGNPLFVLESLRSGFIERKYSSSEPNFRKLPSIYPSPLSDRLPPRIRGVIAARLSHLSAPAHELACLAATIGRAFSYEVLLAASGASVNEMADWLDELWRRHIVRELTDNSYDFNHDKLREVAYAEVSPPRRRLLHQRVAHALELVYAADLNPVSGQIAAHYESAGLIELSIPFYLRAATIAQQVGAAGKAIQLLNGALSLLNTLKESPDRDQKELDLQLALGVSLVDEHGHGAPDVLKVFSRAQALCMRLDRPLNPPILRALAVASIVGAQFKRAIDYGKQLLQLAADQADSVLLVEAHYTIGVASIWLGSFTAAREHLEKAIRHYRPEQSPIHLSLYSQDPKVICLSRLAFLYWCLGYADQAVVTSQKALAYARELAHPFSLAYALLWDGLLHLHLRSSAEVLETAEGLIALSQEQHLSFWLPSGIVLQGWAQAERGEIARGIISIRTGMEQFWAGGARFQHAFFLSLLAEQTGKAGNVADGLSMLVEAQAEMERNEERWCEAEIYRRQGELLILQSDETGAAAAFAQAIKTGHRQKARMLELRAALALAHLYHKLHKTTEAIELLTPLLGGFQEGFATPDLYEAEDFLESLDPSFKRKSQAGRFNNV
jgi:DNA-binding SARP family transcriptional activator/predicted ATPase